MSGESNLMEMGPVPAMAAASAKLRENVGIATKGASFTVSESESWTNVSTSDQLKALQEIAELSENVVATPMYAEMITLLVPAFLEFLENASAQFIAELPEQQIRKQMLEILYRLPVNDTLKMHSRNILVLMFKLLEMDNEENVLLSLRIIIEHHKSYRPPHSNEINVFLDFVRKIYSDLSQNVAAIFAGPQVGSDGEISIESPGMVSQMTITTTNSDGQQLTQTIIPKAQTSLKVLAELPLITVLFYQLYKQQVHKTIGDFFHTVTATLAHQAPKRNSDSQSTFSDELYVDFMTAQVKTLSFVAYGLKAYPEIIRQHAQPLAEGIMGLLRNCPSEVSHLRKEIMVATKHIFSSELRNNFIPHVNELFDDSVFIGTSYTVRESLRALCYNTLADLVHHIKISLSFTQSATAIHYFSKCLLDDSLPVSLQATSAKLLLSLGSELICAKATTGNSNALDKANSIMARQIQLRLLQVFVKKFKVLSEYHLPLIFRKCEELSKSGSGADDKSSNLKSSVSNSGSQEQSTAADLMNPGEMGAETGVDNATGSSSGGGDMGGPKNMEDVENEEADKDTTANMNVDIAMSSEPNKVGQSETAGIDKKSASDPRIMTPSPSEGVIPPMSASECRNLVRVLVMGAKSVAQSLSPLQQNSNVDTSSSSRMTSALSGSRPSESEIVQVLRDLLYYALRALDIYLVTYSPQGVPYIRPPSALSPGSSGGGGRMKEEKEILEWFSHIYTSQPVNMFTEVFTEAIHLIVQRLQQNYALQIIVNSFLATASTSPAFATILVEYLLERMADIGGGGCDLNKDALTQSSKSEVSKAPKTENRGATVQQGSNCNNHSLDLSNLYLRLFKLVFGSVSLLAHANEQMLKPHLHAIVDRSMKLAQTARDPINYFYLLRALFRSIGGGSHDLLYQEFLPLLCNLLQGLNLLQSGHHKSQVKDLFVELSLTVPVRLSSLLPYLPLLMGPLVSALTGSSALINQGLRTLELFVDNLQPDFLYDHIQPVRAELMQALWKTVRNSNPVLATTAFRVLGKFGGANRKMMKEPQELVYNDFKTNGSQSGIVSPGIRFKFNESTETAFLPIASFVSMALEVISSNSEDEFYQNQSFCFIRTIIDSCIQRSLPSKEMCDHYVNSIQDQCKTKQHCTKNCTVYNTALAPRSTAGGELRKLLEDCLVGLFTATCIKALEKEVNSYAADVTKALVLISSTQHFLAKNETCPSKANDTHNGFLLFDDDLISTAITRTLKTETLVSSQTALAVIDQFYNTFADLIGGQQLTRLPFFQFLLEKVCDCFYEKAWFKKQSGCQMLDKLLQLLDQKFILLNQSKIVVSLQYAFIDLSGEVSNGVLESLSESLTNVLRFCCTGSVADGQEENEDELIVLRLASREKVVADISREVASSNSTLRYQMSESLRNISEWSEMSLGDLLKPQMSFILDLIPPVKHRLRFLPVNTQIGLMNANTFLLTELGSVVLSYDVTNSTHVEYLDELFYICETDDETLKKTLSSTKSASNENVIFDLREAALRNLAACHFISEPSYHEHIFTVIYDALNSTNDDIQKVGDKCMATFLAKCGKDKRQKAYEHMRELLKSLMNSYKVLNLNAVARLSSLSTLFPQSFNERFCRSIVMEHLTCWVRDMTEIKQNSPDLDYSLELKTCSQIINMFHLLPTAPVSLVEPLIELVISTEGQIGRDFANPMRPPLLKFLAQHPETSCGYFMQAENLKSEKKVSLFLYGLKHDIGQPLLSFLKKNSSLFFKAGLTSPSENSTEVSQLQTDLTVQNNIIKILHLVCVSNKQWIASQPDIVMSLRVIWDSPEFNTRHGAGLVGTEVLWTEAEMLIECLVAAFLHDSSAFPDTKLLFSMIRVLNSGYLSCASLVLKNFLSEGLKILDIPLRRKVFLEFTELFEDPNLCFESKAKFISAVITPQFKETMLVPENVDELLGEKPNPESENQSNLLNVFLTKFVVTENNYPDCVRIAILQLACLFVEFCAPHIHDAVSKRQQGQKMRKLMGFAWPCLLNKACIDPSTKYHGHLLLAHIIAKFPINKKIVLQVFYSLLKAHGQETRNVIRESLDLLTPSLSRRMDDGDAMLAHCTKKIMTEEGHALPQMLHITWLIVKHQQIFFRVRRQMSGMMVGAMNRLVLSSSVSLDNRRQAIDIAEVFISWQKEAKSNSLKSAASNASDTPGPSTQPTTSATENKDEELEQYKIADNVINFLMRIAASIHDSANVNSAQCDLYVRRCLDLLASALSKEVWGLPEGNGVQVDVRISWMEKVLMSSEQSNVNVANLVTSLDLLTLSLNSLSQDAFLSNLKTIQKGLTTLLHCKTSRIHRPFHEFISKLLKAIPPVKTYLIGNMQSKSVPADPNFDDSIDDGENGNVSSPEKQQQHTQSASSSNQSVSSLQQSALDSFYDSVYRCIYDGLLAYEKSAQMINYKVVQPIVGLLSAVYLDTSHPIESELTEKVIRCMQRLVREHLAPSSQMSQSDHAVSDLIVTIVKVMQPRLTPMNPELRKLFIQILMVSLIEKTTDSKVILSLISCFETWIRGSANTSIGGSLSTSGPTLREKSLLLFKMMNSLEKRFPDDANLQAAFLKIVLYVYKDEELKKTELSSKLESAFMCGLRFSSDPELRTEFFNLWKESIGTKSVYNQLLYIVSSQNWESMHDHFWIKQCVQLVLAADKSDYQFAVNVSNNPAKRGMPVREEVIKMEVDESEDRTKDENNTWSLEWCERFVNEKVVTQSGNNLESFLNAIGHLLNKSNEVAHKAWIDLLPQVWKCLTHVNRKTLSAELNPFLISGAHLIQRDSPNSTIRTFLEALGRCQPSITLRPVVLKYIGKSHNSWHRSLLWLENVYERQHPGSLSRFLNPTTDNLMSSNHNQESSGPGGHTTVAGCSNSSFNEYYDTLDWTVCQPRDTFECLNSLCHSMHEQDLWAALWISHAQYPETAAAIAYQVQGLFVEAQQTYESVIGTARGHLDSNVAAPALLPEFQLWEQEWMECCRQLNEWEVLSDVSKSEDHPNPHLILECAWRQQDWKKVEDTLNIVEINSAREVAWKYQLIRGYLSVFKPESPQVQPNSSGNAGTSENPGGGPSSGSQQHAMESAVSNGISLAIKEWNRLPRIVSLAHVPLLQGCHQLVEVTEAHQIQVGISQQAVNRGASSSLHEMKSVVKTWKNRLATTSDDLSYWSDLFLWRHHSYSAIVNAFEVMPPPQMSPFGQTSPGGGTGAPNEPSQNPYAMQGVHAQAQAIIAFGQIARKHGLYSVCLESLARIHAIASVPIVDCYQKILQQIKCYLKLSAGTDSTELRKGLDVIDQTNLKYFNPEMISDFYALKGMFLNLLADSEEANKAFSAAVQFNDNSIKSWSYWGDYFRTVFMSSKDMEFAKSAILCYLHSCRHQKETKSRVNMAKTLSFLPHDDETNQLSEAIEKCSPGVPTVHWQHWIPQICTSLLRKEGSHMINILINVAKVYPQSVYFPIRTIYTYLKTRIQQDHTSLDEVSSPVKEPMSNEPSSVKTVEPMDTSEPNQTSQQQVSVNEDQPENESGAASNEPMESNPSDSRATSTSSAIEIKVEPADHTTQYQGMGSTTSQNSPSRPPSVTSNSSLSNSGRNTNTTTSGSATVTSLSASSYSKYKTPLKFCTKVIYVQRDAHPTLLAALESIADQVQTLPRLWFEPVLEKLNQMLKEQLDIAFESSVAVSRTQLGPNTYSAINSLLSLFNEDEEVSVPESTRVPRLHQEFILQHKHLDPEFGDLKQRITEDFDFSDAHSARLLPLINKLRKWIGIFEAKAKRHCDNSAANDAMCNNSSSQGAAVGTGSFLMGRKCRFLNNFSAETAEVEVPADFYTTKNSSYSLKVSRFLPRVEIAVMNRQIIRRIFIRASNGKVFAYRVLYSEDQRQCSFGYSDERIAQLMRLMQTYFLDRRKETSKRLLCLSPPAITTFAPNLRLHLDNCSSQSMFDVYRECLMIKELDPFIPVKTFFDQMFQRGTSMEGCASHLNKVFNAIQNTLVPKSRLREWACSVYEDPTDYFTFRKQFTGHLSVLSVLQYVINIQPFELDAVDIVKKSGFLVPAKMSFRNNLSPSSNSKTPIDLSMRLTPNLVDVMGPLGLSGPFFQNFLAVCFALVDPHCKFEAFLSAIMQDVLVLEDKNVLGWPDSLPNDVLLNNRESAIKASIIKLHSIAESGTGSENLKYLLSQNIRSNGASGNTGTALEKCNPAWLPWF